MKDQNEMPEKKISQSAIVTVTDMGHLIEVQHMQKRNSECRIRKLDAYTYLNLETGEICEYEKIDNRSESENSLRQTFKRLRYLINNNFTGKPNELFVTFTFAKKSFDNKEIYKDFDKFLKRLRYKYKDMTTIDYLNVVEPHASGQWHSHMLIRFNDLQRIYIPNKELAELWGNGFVTIKSLKDVDNIGAYVSAYLADLDVPDDYVPKSDKTEVLIKQVDGKQKKFIKGGRLQWYPPGMNLYRKSKGIIFPEREEMSYKNAQKKVWNEEPHFRKTYAVMRDGFENSITIEQYNLKR